PTAKRLAVGARAKAVGKARSGVVENNEVALAVELERGNGLVGEFHGRTPCAGKCWGNVGAFPGGFCWHCCKGLIGPKPAESKGRGFPWHRSACRGPFQQLRVKRWLTPRIQIKLTIGRSVRYCR